MLQKTMLVVAFDTYRELLCVSQSFFQIQRYVLAPVNEQFGVSVQMPLNILDLLGRKVIASFLFETARRYMDVDPAPITLQAISIPAMDGI